MNIAIGMQDIPVCAAKEWRPSRMEALRNYQIGIKFLSIGCIIEVGCKSIPFTSIKEGIDALNEYIANPYDTQKVWEEKFKKEEL